MDKSVLRDGRGSRASPPSSEYSKTRLERLARQLQERLSTPGEPSRDFFMKSLQALASIKSGNVDVRLNCLDSVFKYFYGAADMTPMLRAARLLERLAM